MKKIFTLLFTVISLAGYSQSIGLKGGVNISFSDNSFHQNQTGLVGPTIGFVFKKDLGKVFLAIEPSYSVKGFAIGITKTDNNGQKIDGKERVSYRFSYFEAPIIVGYNFVNKETQFGMHVGISPNIPLSSEFKVKERYNVDVLAGIHLGHDIGENAFWMLNLRGGTGLLNDLNFRYISTFLTVGYKL